VNSGFKGGGAITRDHNSIESLQSKATMTQGKIKEEDQRIEKKTTTNRISLVDTALENSKGRHRTL